MKKQYPCYHLHKARLGTGIPLLLVSKSSSSCLQETSQYKETRNMQSKPSKVSGN